MMIWRSGSDARCDYFNETWLAFTGRTMEQEVGEGWVDGVHPVDVTQCVERYLEAFDKRDLMLNGLEARKDHPGELLVSTQRAAGGEVLISVADRGVGLPMEHVDRIFDAFFTTKAQGTGMGLAISRAIVQAHGGALWAAANLPGGATFQFTLPESISQTAKPLTTDRGRDIPIHDDSLMTQALVGSSPRQGRVG